jgi:tetratricopeptide (TPR) repeat protein
MEGTGADGRKGARMRMRLHRLATEGRFDEADRLADAILAESRDDVQVWYQKGANHFQAERFDDAIAAFDAILRIDRNNAEAWRAKAIAFAEQKLYAEAIPAYRAALRCAPDDPITLNEMGKALANLGHYEEAVTAFRGAVAADSRFGEALHCLAFQLERAGRHDEARRWYDEAVRADPGMTDAWINRGSHFAGQATESLQENDFGLALGLLYEALRSYECALSLSPGHSIATEARTSILEVLGPERARFRPTPPPTAPRCDGEETQ